MNSSTKRALAALLLALPVAALAQQTATFNDGRYIIKMRSQDSAEDRGDGTAEVERGRAEVETSGGIVVNRLDKHRSVVAVLSDAGATRLRGNPKVQSVEPDSRRYPLAQSTPWGVTRVQADNTLFETTASTGNVMVCIIDSGYQRLHVDLPKTNVTGTMNAGSGNWYEDSCGHGSHVAGTIAALDNTYGVVGVNGDGNLSIHVQKVFDGATCGWSYASDLAAAVDNCTAAAAAQGKWAVVSMSLGGGTPSVTEEAAFASATAAGHLMVAAAGNAGTTATSYPAGYATVMSVGAVDSANLVAGFSQKNADVEIAAPGVDVLSTVPTLSEHVLVGGTAIPGLPAVGAAKASVSASLVDGGVCNSVGAWSGKIVICDRDGVVGFATKATNVVNGGGVGIVFVNNLSVESLAPDFGGVTKAIPAIGMTKSDGTALRAFVGQSASLVNQTGAGNGYELYSGTSMATPHVSGVAALIWNRLPARSNTQVRQALTASALDLGATGRDNAYGYGLLQAKAAYDLLAAMPAGSLPPGPGTPPPPPPSTGTAAYTVSVTSLAFGSLLTGTTATQTVTISSTGTGALALSSVSLGGIDQGSYRLTNGCGLSVAGGTSCTISVTFAPTTSGAKSASLFVTPADTALAQKSVALSGTGASGSFTRSAQSVAFGTVKLATTATGSRVTITNSGTLALQFISTSIYATGTGFAQTNTCPATLAPRATCTITPTFRPTIAGVRSGSISIVPKGAALATVLLSGTGK
jgi:subtilisin family serine protease